MSGADTMSPEQLADAATIQALATELGATLAAVPHALALNALLLAYRRLAIANPCCTPGSVLATTLLAFSLQEIVAERSSVQPAHMH